MLNPQHAPSDARSAAAPAARRRPGFFHHRFRGIDYFPPLPHAAGRWLGAGARRFSLRDEGADLDGDGNRKAGAGLLSAQAPVLRTGAATSSISELRFQDCYREMLALDRESVDEAHRKWLTTIRNRDVINLVKKSDHKTLYSLDISDVEKICEETDHALGDLSLSKLRRSPLFNRVQNFNTDFAFLHIFHRMTEEMGRLPLWQEVMP